MKKIIVLTTATALLSSCGIYTKYQPAETTPDNLYGEEVAVDDTTNFGGGNFLRTRSYRLLSNKGYKTTPTSGPPNCRSRKRKRR